MPKQPDFLYDLTPAPGFNTEHFIQAQDNNRDLASATLQREGLPYDRVVVVALAGLAMSGYDPWHPDQKPPLRVEAVVPQSTVWNEWPKRYPVRALVQRAPEVVELGKITDPSILEISAKPEGADSTLAGLLPDSFSTRDGWLTLSPGTLASLMAQSGNPVKIAAVLRAHLAAYDQDWGGAQVPGWQEGVKAAVLAARNSAVLRKSPATRGWVERGFDYHPAFHFLEPWNR